MNTGRSDIVEALAKRDAEAAAKAVQGYHQSTVELLERMSQYKKHDASNPAPSQLVLSLLENTAAGNGEHEARSGHGHSRRERQDRHRFETIEGHGSRK